MNKQEEKKKELRLLGRDIAIREQKIVAEWKNANPDMVRGECNTPEMKALREEEIKRYREILRKYKN